MGVTIPCDQIVGSGCGFKSSCVQRAFLFDYFGCPMPNAQCSHSKGKHCEETSNLGTEYLTTIGLVDRTSIIIMAVNYVCGSHRL